ncbi:MAG: hypothetical protein WAV72_19560 [Bradyrhizobium sp.]
MDKTENKGERKADADRTVKLTWKDISDAELRAILADAKNGGDPAAAMKLIEYFYKRIHDNLPYDQTILLDYLVHGFGGILDGQSADRAFGLERRTAKK